jgi:hypothetical protein
VLLSYQELSHWGEALAAGVKPLLSVQVFLNISPECAMFLGIINENENSRDTFSYQPNIFHLIYEKKVFDNFE